jgi:hypothetical protein
VDDVSGSVEGSDAAVGSVNAPGYAVSPPKCAISENT